MLFTYVRHDVSGCDVFVTGDSGVVSSDIGNCNRLHGQVLLCPDMMQESKQPCVPVIKPPCSQKIYFTTLKC